MREWINGDTQLWDITEEHDSEDVNKAIKEQDTIGWEHLFPIQDGEYEILRSKDQTLGKHFTGTWWTSCSFTSPSTSGRQETIHYIMTELKANEKNGETC